MFLRCFLKINIISAYTQGDTKIVYDILSFIDFFFLSYLFQDSSLYHGHDFLSFLKTHAFSNILSLEVS